MQEFNYIKPEEFLNSWDKDTQNLNYTDFVMFHLINKIGFDLENDFFRSKTVVYSDVLTKDEITDLSFVLIDNLEVFLTSKCISCPLACWKDPNSKIGNVEGIPTLVKDVLANKDAKKIEALSMDIFNYAINPIISKFYESKKDKKNHIFLFRMKKFLEQKIVFYLTEEYRDWLANPQENAEILFEQLKTEENDGIHYGSIFSEENEKNENKFLESGFSEKEKPWLKNDKKDETIIDKYLKSVADRFSSEYILAQHRQVISAFVGFLEKKLKGFSSLKVFSIWIDEFMYVEFPQLFLTASEKDIKYNLIILSKFLHWYDRANQSTHNIHLASILGQYKRDLIRTQQIINKYIKDYNLLFDLFEDQKNVQEHAAIFEVKMISKLGLLLLEDIKTKETFHLVKLDLKYVQNLKSGDILSARLRKDELYWKVRELLRVFPHVSKYYLA